MLNPYLLKMQALTFLINIESSHCYDSLDVFFRQVKRVLCKDGHFLFADFRDVKDLNPFFRSRS